MSTLGLRSRSRGLGLSPRRSRPASDGPTGDSEAPSIPQNLSAIVVSGDQIDLTWDASTDNVGVTGYNIYRDDLLIDTSPTNSYSDTGLEIETAYEYEVSAFDAAANESARSAPDSATTAVARLSPEFVAGGTAGLTGNSADNVGFTYPTADVREDDLLVAVMAVNDRGAAPDIANTATGWTRLAEVAHEELALAVFYRRADGTETGAVTPFDWSAGDGQNDVALCQAYQFRHVDWTGGGPFVGSPVSTTGDLSSLDMPSVTTQGENGLAVAAVGFSDNISATDASAAMGGTWAAPRDPDNTATADDCTVNVLVAPLAEAGTISGGAIAPTPSSPQSSRSIAIGFALRGMVDPETTETLAVSIAASADDARESTSTTAVNISSTTLFLAGQLVGMRFTGLSALASKTIVQANIQLTSSGAEGFGNNGTILIKGEAADTAAQYAASNGDISGRTLTTASRNWIVPGWANEARTLRQRSVDVRTIVQEIADRPGFGGVVNFIVSLASGNSRQCAAWNHSSLQEATLTVRYVNDDVLRLYVDSADGDDGNTGLGPTQPCKTFAGLSQLIEDGAHVHLKRGSVWEEQLSLNLTTGVVVDDYGSLLDPMPKIDTTSAADGGDFSLTSGTTNVYEISWAHEITSIISFLRVWEDGDALTWATSVANCDLTPGSCYYEGRADQANPLTVYVHPKDSTDPTSDGKEYRLSARDYAIFMGTRTTVRDVFGAHGCHNGGPITGDKVGCQLERCILTWGNKHHSVLQLDDGADAAWIDCIVYQQIPTPSQWSGGINCLTAYRAAPTGGNFMIKGCVVYMPTLSTGGWIAHTNGGGTFGKAAVQDNYVYNMFGSISGEFGPVTSHLTKDNYIENGSRGITSWGTVQNVDGLTLVNMKANFRLAYAIAAGAVLNLTDVCLHTDNPASGGIIWGAATDEYEVKLDHCSIYRGPTVFSSIFSDDLETTAEIHDCIFHGNNVLSLEAEFAVESADRNVYFREGASPNFNTGNVTKVGLAAWQTFSGLDGISVEADPQWAGDLAEGDFSLDLGSPALADGRSAGARRWRTRPDWDALVLRWEAGFYAHPTDAIGGSQLVV